MDDEDDVSVDDIKRRLDGPAGRALRGALASAATGQIVDEYAVGDVKSAIDTKTADEVRVGSCDVVSVEERLGDDIVCRVTGRGVATVNWMVSSPDPEDDGHPDAVGERGSGFWIERIDPHEPMVLAATAILCADDTWRDVQIDDLSLDPTELQRRR